MTKQFYHFSFDQISNAEQLLVIGADLRMGASRTKLERILEAFRAAQAAHPTSRLALAVKRTREHDFSVLNWIEAANLSAKVTLHPYFDQCRSFPFRKSECVLWIDSQTLDADITAGNFNEALANSGKKSPPTALFVTSFHPAKAEGNSALMRQWLQHLRAAGYWIDVLYYELEKTGVPAEKAASRHWNYDSVLSVPVESKLVGRNRNGLNVHVDDWCGGELLDAASHLTEKTSYDVAIVNYPFMSAVFERVPAYTRRILVTHDSFADRNRRMLANGMPESGWVSIDEAGEALACQRADAVVALQDEEAGYFRKLLGTEHHKVHVIGPIAKTIERRAPARGNKLIVGYLGSANWVNEHNLTEFLKLWAASDVLLTRAELVIGGGLCETLPRFASADLLLRVSPHFVGKVDQLQTFFNNCDLFINPERGGTGIKIKSLDAMAHGIPLLSTKAGSVGIGSESRFHNAANLEALAHLLEEIAENPARLDDVAADTKDAQAAYFERHRNSMSDLLGPPVTQVHQGHSAAVDSEDAIPAVSIVIPFYGVEQYIEACLNSVIEQTFQDFEVILVDDASLDGSRQIAEKIAATDGRIRIVTHAQNRGLGPARNTGVGEAYGEYIFFLDSDDLLASPDTLSTLISAARRTGCEVVTASSEQLMPDGSITPFDRMHDELQRGKPGQILRGRDAYIAAMYVPGGGYLPMRAWGTLISREYYERLDHHFPAGEHEDLPHTPILYARANGVYYEPAIGILYRARPGGLSTSVWSAAKLCRYQALWTEMRLGLSRHGLASEAGDAAVKFAEHLIWKLTAHGLAGDADGVFIQTIETILADAAGASNFELTKLLLGQIQNPAFIKPGSLERVRNLKRYLPFSFMIQYYRDRLAGFGVQLPENLPEKHLVAVAPVPAPAPGRPQMATDLSTPTEPPALSFKNNDELATSVIRNYEGEASEASKTFPAMLTLADRAAYFHAGKNYGFRGAIIDAGCFVGGTTISLIDGLQNNPLFKTNIAKSHRLIRVYDLFRIDDDYILDHLREKFPHLEFRTNESFLHIFRENLAAYADYLDVRPGDVTALGYNDLEPIEILGVDLCKALPVTDHVVREFFPRLLAGALVLQQDFIHEFHPHIHLSMLRLREFFDPFVEFRWGGTVSFKVRKTISNADILTAFGKDSSWFKDTATNAQLLRQMIDAAHYDENRWIYILTLGVYHAANGQTAAARAAYDEACTRFPQFRPSVQTQKLIAG